MLGVDLIYVNDTMGNIVMVQYKMLEEVTRGKGSTHDHIFRPDGQFEIELRKMKLPAVMTATNDYRLSSDPFFFKFVKRTLKREPVDDFVRSFLVSIGHLNHLLESTEFIGPRGGIRISFRALEGNYLRETAFLGLIRSGYIGTHRAASEALHIILADVAKGERAVVLAWQGDPKQDNKER